LVFDFLNMKIANFLFNKNNNKCQILIILFTI
jgi:hypothetical protein